MKPLAETELGGRRSRSYVYVISLVAAAGGFNWGFDIILMSGAILYLKKHFNFAALNIDLFPLNISSAWIEGFTMTSAMYGTILGMLLGGSLADRSGRKRALGGAEVLRSTVACMSC